MSPSWRTAYHFVDEALFDEPDMEDNLVLSDEPLRLPSALGVPFVSQNAVVDPGKLSPTSPATSIATASSLSSRGKSEDDVGTSSGANTATTTTDDEATTEDHGGDEHAADEADAIEEQLPRLDMDGLMMEMEGHDHHEAEREKMADVRVTDGNLEEDMCLADDATGAGVDVEDDLAPSFPKMAVEPAERSVSVEFERSRWVENANGEAHGDEGQQYKLDIPVVSMEDVIPVLGDIATDAEANGPVESVGYPMRRTSTSRSRDHIIEDVVGGASRTKAGTLVKLVERLTGPDVNDADYVLTICRAWVLEASEDFENDELSSSFLSFLQDVVKRDKLESAGGIISLLARQRELKRPVELPLISVTSEESTFILPDELASLVSKFIWSDKKSVAFYIDIIEAKLTVAIRRDELLSLAWGKSFGTTLAPNITRKINSFNGFSRLVTLSILSTKSLRERVKVLKNFIRLAQICARSPSETDKIPSALNLDVTVAILSALQSAGVSRLKLTWKDLSRKTRSAYDELCDLISPRYNYKNLRKAVGASGVTTCIPYLGLYLQDLTFVADGNPATLPTPTVSAACLAAKTSASNLRSSVRSSRASISSLSSLSSTLSHISSSATLTLRSIGGAALGGGDAAAGVSKRPHRRATLSTTQLINFERCRMMARVVMDFRKRQDGCGRFLASVENALSHPHEVDASCEELVNRLYAVGRVSSVDDATLFNMSIECEPRRANAHNGSGG
ncbi:RasGEF, partial [Irineochytrium annulatum]